MKNFYLLLSTVLISMNTFVGYSAELITLTFSENDYSFSYNEKGQLEISSSLTVSYPSANVPALPTLTAEIAVNSCEKYVSSTPTFTKRLIKTNVEVAQSPKPVTTNNLSSQEDNLIITYPSNASYPASNCKYITTSTWGDISVLHFITSPFIYDARTKNLFFIDSISLNVSTSSNTSRSETEEELLLKPADSAFLKTIVKNPTIVDEISISRNSIPTQSTKRIDYLIVTSEELKDDFEPLKKWKNLKGLYADIVTIEEVYETFPDFSPQLALKKYLYEMFAHNCLKYVLLGGDETIIPVQECVCEVNEETDTIPSDLYYACFYGDFEWDGNGNGIYGEANDEKRGFEGDNIDFSQSIYVTRVPVNTTAHVDAFVTKLLSYEGCPTKKSSTDNSGTTLVFWDKPNVKWNNEMLLAGVQLYTNYADKSDAEACGDRIIQNAINFKDSEWTGNVLKFYDTYTDFEGGSKYNVTNQNLTDQISRGYAFIGINAHGYEEYWVIEGDIYSTTNAMNQTNCAFTNLTTQACLTNAFDFHKPSLSERFIQNPNSGIVSYLGCSRSGWLINIEDQIGPSEQYESIFYKNLFAPYIDRKNYGFIVAASKAAMIALCDTNNAYRYLQFGLNPIGDPEMPIYTSNPKQFENIKIEWKGDQLDVLTGVSNCRICVMSSIDDGNSYYKTWDYTSGIRADNVPEKFYICITCPGYIPEIINSEKLVHQIEIGIIGPGKPIGPLGGILSCSREAGSDIATVTTIVNSETSSASLSIRNINGSFSKTVPVPKEEYANQLNISTLRSGVNIVSLYIDGMLIDSCEIIK